MYKKLIISSILFVAVGSLLVLHFSDEFSLTRRSSHKQFFPAGQGMINHYQMELAQNRLEAQEHAREMQIQQIENSQDFQTNQLEMQQEAEERQWELQRYQQLAMRGGFGGFENPVQKFRREMGMDNCEATCEMNFLSCSQTIMQPVNNILGSQQGNCNQVAQEIYNVCIKFTPHLQWKCNQDKSRAINDCIGNLPSTMTHGCEIKLQQCEHQCLRGFQPKIQNRPISNFGQGTQQNAMSNINQNLFSNQNNQQNQFSSGQQLGSQLGGQRQEGAMSATQQTQQPNFIGSSTGGFAGSSTGGFGQGSTVYTSYGGQYNGFQ